MGDHGTDVQTVEFVIDSRPRLNRQHESRELCGHLDRTNNGYTYKTQEHDDEYEPVIHRRRSKRPRKIPESVRQFFDDGAEEDGDDDDYNDSEGEEEDEEETRE